MAAKLLMVLGTSSSAGKTTISTALCRILKDLGLSVAPFKAANMSLNSISLPDGSEIARAQWLQAMACGIDATRDMNPILLKPEGGGKSQLIVRGTAIGVKSFSEYGEFMASSGKSIVSESLSSLIEGHDAVVIEGAGSPAEINMMDTDLANTYIMKEFNPFSILVGDIEKGGVFASLYGTLSLMPFPEKVGGLVINRMRGNRDILQPGIRKLEDRTGKKVLGVMPYLDGLLLPGEDSLDYEISKTPGSEIAVIRYPHAENYSDLDSLFFSGLGTRLVNHRNQEEMEKARLIILPGSKRADLDLEYLRSSGMDFRIRQLASGGVAVLGICGGYQMLGKEIDFGAGKPTVQGIGLLDSSTVYGNVKKTGQVEYCGTGSPFPEDVTGVGYEIHYGSVNSREPPLFKVGSRGEGSASETSRVFGTNIHGILENPKILSLLLGRKIALDYNQVLEANIDRLSEEFRKNVDLSPVMEFIR